MFRIYELIKACAGKADARAKDIRVKSISTDSRRLKPGDAFIAIKGPNFDGHDFIPEAIKKGASCIIGEARNKLGAGSREQGVPFIEVRDTIRALGDIARYWRGKFDVPVVAVTGSTGKTTVKEMLAWVLSAKFNVLKNNGTQNNHIGLPLTLLNLKSEHDVAVVEMGTNHFGEIGYLAKIAQPNMGIITNIAAAHLEHFGDLKGVFREKSALLKYLKHPHIALLNADDKFFIKQIARRGSLPLIFGFGLKERSDFSASGIKIGAGRIAFSANQHRFSLRSRGYYNVYNALAAVAAGRIFGLQYKEIAARISSFEFLPGRLKLIELGGIQFIDDTYNSNPASLRQALEALESIKVRGRKILVMGDMLELGSQEEAFHVEAGKKIARACDAFIAVGDLAGLAAKAAKKCGLDLNNIFRCASSRQAKDILFKRMAPGPQDIVLVKGSRAMNMEEVFKL